MGNTDKKEDNLENVEKSVLGQKRASRVRQVKPKHIVRRKHLGDVENLTEELLFEHGRRIADRMRIGRRILDRLYARSGWRSLSRSAWEAEVKCGNAIDMLLRNIIIRSPTLKFESLVDREATDEAFSRLAPQKGTLLMTFHGTFVPITRRLFQSKTTTLARQDVVAEGGRSALFGAFRTLQDGNNLLMAPDGPFGRKSECSSVFDRPIALGEGAAFLAYSTNCNTAWYAAVIGERGFKADIELGPTRDTGEKFDDYRDRLYRFYAAQIQKVFSGDPRNLVLRQKWKKWVRRLPRLNSPPQ
jgi:hypothetical protein